MDRKADLGAALRFVRRRIEEEAARAGEPLTDEQHALLNHLPDQSTFTFPSPTDSMSAPTIIPRDLVFERLCALAKTAHSSDLELNEPETLDWEFAIAVLKLKNHPMFWLLKWAGLDVHRPWWDSWLLFAVALLLIFSTVGLGFLGVIESWSRIEWIAVGTGCIVIVAFLFFVSQRIEDWQIRQSIAKTRRHPEY